MSSTSMVRKGSKYHRLDNIPSNTFTPRTYQIQLLDVALQKNSLLCLGCPTSKLFLALMVAREMGSATRLPLRQGGKRTFYLIDSDDDLDMISSTLPHHTDLIVGRWPLILNHTNTDDASALTPSVSSENSIMKSESIDSEHQKWHQLVEENNIIVVTGSNFLTALEQKYVGLEVVNLLIFDDCHLAVEGEELHPYAQIVSLVKMQGIDGKYEPHILGVTAAIAGTDCSDPVGLKETISSMEQTLHARAQTSMLILTERFGCRPRQNVVRCDLEDNYYVDDADYQSELRQNMEELLLRDYHFFIDCHDQLRKQVGGGRDPGETPRQVLEQCLTILAVLGPWCCSSVGEYFLMQLEKICKVERCELTKRCLRLVMTSLRYLTHTFNQAFQPDYCIDQFLAYATPKVRALVQSLHDFKPQLDFIILNNDSDDLDDENSGDFSDLSDDDDGDEDDEDEDNLGSSSDTEGDNPNKGQSSSKPVHIAVKRTPDGGTERITSFQEEEERNLCGIVFVENRYIAFGLHKVIEEVCAWDENLCFVKSCHITGQGLRGAGQTKGKTGSTRACRRQEEALRRFRSQEVNLVIATPELEDGIDIPKCNLVVRFDPPRDYRSYTLSKGRARARDASYVILLDSDTHEGFQAKLEVFKGIEQVLMGNPETDIQQRAEESNETDDSEDEGNGGCEAARDGDTLPAYKTIPGSVSSPQVTMQSAIALVNRYCAKLPSDAFTHLTPQCRLERRCDLIVAYLRLPINSPVKEELQGPPMRSKKLAKMAVALKMCQILHEKGELDDQLVPVGKEMFVYEEEEEWSDDEDAGGQARPGTTKRKQYYTKKVADVMVKSQPKPNQPSFLHVISMHLTGPITEEQNTRGRSIYAPEDTRQTLGLILDKPIPQMPCFPVYTRSGEVTVSVDLLCSNVVLTEEQISRLLKFHHFVFSDVLHLEKEPMEFFPSEADYSFLVVPLNGESELTIDWEFLEKVIKFSPVDRLVNPSKKRKMGPSKAGETVEKDANYKFDFCVTDFEDAVVMPSYRNMDQPQHFYVAEIRTDLNPLSPFPSPELYKTFQDYYTTKYGLEITCKDQPLLDVDHTSARLNLLTPRYMNPKGMALPTSSAETKRARRENLQQKQILVPELCTVHIFPASLWRKAVCLPAVLYRSNCLLLAEELRQKVAKNTGIGLEKLPTGFRFPQLDFGFDTNPEKLRNLEKEDDVEETPAADHTSHLSQKGDSLAEQEDLSLGLEVVNHNPQDQEQNAEQIVRNTMQEMLEDESNQAQIDSSVMPKDSVSIPFPSNSESTDSQHDVESLQEGDISPEKADSASSSDSDSGIASSGSDSNLGLDAASYTTHAHSKQHANLETESKYLKTKDGFPETEMQQPSITTTAERRNSDASNLCQATVISMNSNSFYTNSIHSSNCDSKSLTTETSRFYPQYQCNVIGADHSHITHSVDTADIIYEIHHIHNDIETLSASEARCKLFTISPVLNDNDDDDIDKLNSITCSNIKANYPSISSPSLINDAESFSSECIPTEPALQSYASNASCIIQATETNPTDILSEQDTADNTTPQTHQQSVQENSNDPPISSSPFNVSQLPSKLHHPLPKSKSIVDHVELSSEPTECPAASHEKPSESAIVMNTLEQELIGLDIDLICPLVSTDKGAEAQLWETDSGKNNHQHRRAAEYNGKTSSWGDSREGFVHNESTKSNDTSTSDADTIKFSFNAEKPAETPKDLVIDNWGVKSDQLKQSSRTKTDQQAKENDKDQSILQKGTKSESQCHSGAADQVQKKVVQAGDSKCQVKEEKDVNKSSVERVPSPNPTKSDHAHCKDFDIGVWNVRERRKSPVPVSHKTNSSNILTAVSTNGSVSLDEDQDLSNFPGPSPCLILQALTMSNANDFFSLERLETIGDSFLKYAITVYLYCCYPGIHEGKLSYLRSKQVSNYNLYRLGRRKFLAERMVPTKFEPYENWLPPGFVINEDRRRGPVPKVLIVPPEPRDEPTSGSPIKGDYSTEDWPEDIGGSRLKDEAVKFRAELDWLQHSQELDQKEECTKGSVKGFQGGQMVAYCLQQHHGLPDKSVADCVEALIGCYLTTCGRKAALHFMSWLGLRVLPKRSNLQFKSSASDRDADDAPGVIPWKAMEHEFGELQCPASPMFSPTEENQVRLEQLLEGFAGLEDTIQYHFRDRSYLLQAFTHASYHYNTITDCYQRVEFLGDAILDYVITRHLYEDSRQHSPGTLTDLRSALVNNNIFAALAVKWGFHKYFKAVSPALFQVIDTFVKSQQAKGLDHIDIDEEYQEMSMEEAVQDEAVEDEDDDGDEEVEMEIPKALGDIFESVAGAIYLDSGMSLDAVWTVYYRMMKPHIDKYLKSIPKSPVRELLETEPETAKFERPQRTVNGKVRVTVNVVGKGEFSGVGRNYRIAKSAAAKRALRSIRLMAENLQA